MLNEVLLHLKSVTQVQDVAYNVIISQLFGYASIGFWICVFIPQFYENYKNKSSESLSLAFILLWASGDIFNLVGAVAQNLIPSAIMLSVYFLLSDVVIISQIFYYRNKGASKKVTSLEETTSLQDSDPSSLYGSLQNQDEIIPSVDLSESNRPSIFYTIIKAAAAIIIFIIPICVLLNSTQPMDTPMNPTSKPEVVWWAAMSGWISTILFCSAKFPQIHLNYRRKATDGLSVTMFIFCCLANVTYILSILIFSLDLDYLICNLPWLVGAFIPIVLDCIIMGQFFWYRPSPTTSQV